LEQKEGKGKKQCRTKSSIEINWLFTYEFHRFRWAIKFWPSEYNAGQKKERRKAGSRGKRGGSETVSCFSNRKMRIGHLLTIYQQKRLGRLMASRKTIGSNGGVHDSRLEEETGGEGQGRYVSSVRQKRRAHAYSVCSWHGLYITHTRTAIKGSDDSGGKKGGARTSWIMENRNRKGGGPNMLTMASWPVGEHLAPKEEAADPDCDREKS